VKVLWVLGGICGDLEVILPRHLGDGERFPFFHLSLLPGNVISARCAVSAAPGCLLAPGVGGSRVQSTQLGPVSSPRRVLPTRS